MKAIFRCMPLVAALSLTSVSFAADTESPTWKSVSASDNSTYAIKSDGTLWGWGSNELGELGQGSTDQKSSSTPLQIGNDNDWKAVYGARGGGFFIKENGTLWTVGSNEYGMSGVGDGVTKHASLVQVGSDSDWASLATSIAWCYTVLGIKTDGSLWAWGYGSTFCLGQGNTNNSAVPVRIGTDTDWKSVTIGDSHVLALKNDGSLYGWGFAPYFQLMNSETNIKVPTKISEEKWEAVYAIDNASYGVKADGTLWAWGDNQLNLLGLNSDMSELGTDETLPNVMTPTQVTAITAPVTSISGCQYVRVVVAGNKVYAWGANANGALGDGNGTAYEVGANQFSYTPVEVSLPENTAPVKLSSGQRFSSLLDSEGTIYGWGSNRWGQMGNFADDTNLTFEPTPIVMGVPAPPKPGEYVFDAENIPSSLADAITIKMTGEWNTAALATLCNAIGANLGFPPVGNSRLESVDMSEVTFAENTSFYVSAGLQNAGVFKMCKALKSVKFPTNSSAANITSLQDAFWNCASLSSCDISALTGVKNINNVFYGTDIAMVNMAAWEQVTSSQDAFGLCDKLASVILPAHFTVSKFLFNSCSSLRLIDWSLYPEENAPVIASDAFVFQDLTEEQQALITMMVPEKAFESFKADATWAYINLQPVGQPEEGVYTVDANNIPGDLKDARRLTLNGRWETANFKALCDALGNNATTSGNSVLEYVDMSMAEIAIGTNLSAQFPGILGTVEKGIFQNCKTLAEVVMPDNSQAANFRSFLQAFFGCENLKAIDLSGCTGLNQTAQTFYGCTLLENVVLPGTFAFASETFDRCESLNRIDWSSFEGSEAPAFKTNSLPMRGKELTIIVPNAAFDSFNTADVWKNFNIVRAASSSVDAIENDRINDGFRPVYDMSGRRVTTLAPGQPVNSLPTGLYIIAGRKVFVK